MSPDQLHVLIQGWVFMVSLAFGSFLNVCIARMPEDRSVVHPPSHCPSCGAGIRWHDNIPVLSWALLLRGKCRDCKTAISPLYPTIELLVGVLGLLLFRHIIPGPAELIVPNLAAWAVYFLFVFMLVGGTFVDLRHYILPDQFTIYAIPVGVAASAMLHHLGYEGAISWQQSVVGALVGGGVLIFFIGLWWLVRRVEGMGFGDVKLLAMMGAFLGALPAIPAILILASMAGSIIGIGLMIRQGRSLSMQVPFGPFLSVAAIVWVFFAEDIVNIWLGPGAMEFLSRGL